MTNDSLRQAYALQLAANRENCAVFDAAAKQYPIELRPGQWKRIDVAGTITFKPGSGRK